MRMACMLVAALLAVGGMASAVASNPASDHTAQSESLRLLDSLGADASTHESTPLELLENACRIVGTHGVGAEPEAH